MPIRILASPFCHGKLAIHEALPLRDGFGVEVETNVLAAAWLVDHTDHKNQLYHALSPTGRHAHLKVNRNMNWRTCTPFDGRRRHLPAGYAALQQCLDFRLKDSNHLPSELRMLLFP